NPRVLWARCITLGKHTERRMRSWASAALRDCDWLAVSFGSVGLGGLAGLHGDLVAVGVDQLAVLEAIAVRQAGQVLFADHSAGPGNEHRLVVGVAGPQMVEEQVQED